MAFNGTGTFVRVYNWVTDRTNGIKILATKMDTEMDGFATGLSTCITKDGQTTVSANIPMASHKFTGLSVGNARTDSITLGQVQDGQFLDLGTLGGAADAYTASPSPTITAYAASQEYTAKIPTPNLTTTPYLQISAIASPASTAVIKKLNASGAEIALEIGDLVGVHKFKRNTANDAFIVLNPLKPYLNGANISSFLPAGAIVPFAGSAVPTGFLYADGSAVSRTTYATLFAVLVTADAFSAQTFTVTIASPGVFTKSSHGFLGGERIRLTTSGALPTGLAAATDYFVKYIDANTYKLATTLGGTDINTSGSQSGTHTYTQSRYGLGDGSTTFNLPDYRNQFGRGYSSTRTLGSGQLDAFQGHLHGRGESINNNLIGGGSGAYVRLNIESPSNTDGPVSDGTNGTPRTATETRPVNIALNYCIKY